MWLGYPSPLEACHILDGFEEMRRVKIQNPGSHTPNTRTHNRTQFGDKHRDKSTATIEVSRTRRVTGHTDPVREPGLQESKFRKSARARLCSGSGGRACRGRGAAFGGPLSGPGRNLLESVNAPEAAAGIGGDDGG